MFVKHKYDDVLEVFHESSHELDWIHEQYHFRTKNAKIKTH
jgi:hypothetical protein